MTSKTSKNTTTMTPAPPVPPTSTSGKQSIMHAAVLDTPGNADAFRICSVPIPEPSNGWVRIRVCAFGINRSELYTRRGLSGDAVTFPRILGIEAAGTVDCDPSGTWQCGTRVVTMMGGMGRSFDGSYAEYVVVPASQVIPVTSELPWKSIGAVPEMLQTAYGSLTVGVDAQPGQTLLIRGGTSSVGMAAAILAAHRGLTVISTTRDPSKRQLLNNLGVDRVIIDDGNIAATGLSVDAAIELVGTNTLRDTLRCVRVHGTVCFTGMLSNEWTIPDFYPMDVIPNGVRLTAYSGEASDLPAEVLNAYLDDVAAGRIHVPIGHVFNGLDSITQAHRLMESGQANGKIVVLL